VGESVTAPPRSAAIAAWVKDRFMAESPGVNTGGSGFAIIAVVVVRAGSRIGLAVVDGGVAGAKSIGGGTSSDTPGATKAGFPGVAGLVAIGSTGFGGAHSSVSAGFTGIGKASVGSAGFSSEGSARLGTVAKSAFGASAFAIGAEIIGVTGLAAEGSIGFITDAGSGPTFGFTVSGPRSGGKRTGLAAFSVPDGDPKLRVFRASG